MENKKIKEEFVVLEESDYKQESQEIEELNLGDLNNQVTNIFLLSCAFKRMKQQKFGGFWPFSISRCLKENKMGC